VWSEQESVRYSHFSRDMESLASWNEDEVYAVGWGVQKAMCSGYFKKENAKTFGFTKRWYKLQGHVLLYYENEHKSKAKGVIDVTDAAISIVAVEPTARKPNGCYADMVLQIQTPARTYKLWPKYNDDLILWQAAVTIPPCSPSTTTAASPGVEVSRPRWGLKTVPASTGTDRARNPGHEPGQNV
jgi:hypothetical protein